jgi:hypothetical protein
MGRLRKDELGYKKLIRESKFVVYVGVLRVSAELGDDLVLMRHKDLPGTSLGIWAGNLTDLSIVLAAVDQFIRHRRPIQPPIVVRDIWVRPEVPIA